MTLSFEQNTDAQADSASNSHVISNLFEHAHALARNLISPNHEKSTHTLTECGFPQLDIEGSVKKQAIKELDDHVGDLVRLASMLPPGKIDVASAFAEAHRFNLPMQGILKRLGLPADDRTIQMLSNLQSIEKSPHGVVTIIQKTDEVIPLAASFGPLHAVQINDLRLAKKITFKLAPGSEELSRIFGVSIEGQGGVPSRPLISDVRDIKVLKDGDGQTVISTKASNPENSLERFLTKDGDDIPVQIKLKHDGKVEVSHGKQTGT
jgi:hypothetical protein